ncbi:MAG: YdeI/OmpD-associated family protein [Pseudomonadota bacterium]
MTYFPHAFEAPVDTLDIGKGRTVTYMVLFLPPELEGQLPFDAHPRLRVEGEIADMPVRGAWNPVGDGRRYFIVSPQVRKNAGLTVGHMVEMRFRIDDQDRVDVPIPLMRAIRADADLYAKWTALTAGKQRMYAHHVSGAKTAPTIQRRLNECLAALACGMTIRDWQTANKAKQMKTD